MRIDLDQVLKDYEGNPLKQGDGDKDLTLAIACTGAVSNPQPEDNQLSADVTKDRWLLSMRCHAGGEVDFTPEELTLIRGRLPKQFSVLIAGQAVSMLE